MRAATRFFCLSLASAVGLLAAACPVFSADWVDHRSEEGNYTVRFPGTPKTSVKNLQSDLGKFDMHMASLEEGGVGYTVVHAKLTALAETIPSDQFLENAKSAITKNGFAITTTAKISLDGFPGLEMHGTNAQKGLHLRARVYLVNTMMYQVMIASKDEKLLADANADKFVSSFKLLKTPAKK